MVTFNELLVQDRDHWKSSRDNVIAMGVEVPEGTPPELIAEKILEISKGSSDAIFIKSDVWEETDLPTELRGITLYTFTSKGAFYISSAVSTALGIWKFEIATKEWTKPLATNLAYMYAFNQWYETIDGIILAASSRTFTGGGTSAGLAGGQVVVLNRERTLFTRVNVGTIDSTNQYGTMYGFGERIDTLTGVNVVFFNYANRSRVSSTSAWANPTYMVASLINTDDYKSINNNEISVLRAPNKWFTSEHNFSEQAPELYVLDNGAFFKESATTPNLFVKITAQDGSGAGNDIFETSWGDIFITGNNIYKLIGEPGMDDRLLIQVLNGRWSTFIEVFPNEIFVIGNEPGIFKLNEDKESFSSFSEDEYSIWSTFYLSNDNRLFLGSIYNEGLQVLDGDRTLFRLIDSSYYIGLIKFQEIGDDVFVSADYISKGDEYGIYKIDSESNFSQVFGYGYSYIGNIDGNLVSSVQTAYPIFNANDLSASNFRISGIVVGKWILNPAQFTKYIGSVPMEVFVPSKYQQSLSPIGDVEGNVFIITAPKLIFNVKPL